MADLDHDRRRAEIVSRAASLPNERRDVYVLEACGTDALLRRDVQHALASMSESRAHSPSPTGRSDRLPDSGGSSQSPALPAPPIAEGASHEDLRLVRELGHGAQGLVFRGVQISLDRPVAIKFLRPSALDSSNSLERFRREGQAAGRLRHPNVVTVYGTGIWGDHAFLVSELVEGGDLASALAERASSFDATHAHWAADICRRIALGLQHAHERHVVHRDLKPGNVLLDERGEPKICDFGLAKVEDRIGLSMPGAVLGTPAYMSPEQVSSDFGEVGPRSDVYSLGAVLYKLLTRRVPFSGKTLRAHFHEIVAKAPAPPSRLSPGLDPDLEAVCLKALEKQPERRYPSAAAMADDLARFLAGEPTHARPLGPLGRALRALARQSTPALGAGLLLAVVTAFVLDVFATGPACADAIARGAGAATFALRLATLAAFATVCAWPAALLARRLLRERRGSSASGVLLVVLAAALGTGRAVEQQTAARFQRARLLLEREVDLSTRRDVSDLEAFIDAWESDFEVPDLYLLARGFLSRGRLAQTEAWSARLQAVAPGTPMVEALLALAAAASADGESERLHLERLWAFTPTDWRAIEWRRVGQLMVSQRRWDEADRAYRQASVALDGSPGWRDPEEVESHLYTRARLGIEHALVLQALCRIDEATEKLRFLDWFEEYDRSDPRALQLQFDTALEAGDRTRATSFLERIETGSTMPTSARLDCRRRYLQAFEGQAASRAYVDDAVRGAPDDPVTLGWAASRTFQDASAARLSGRHADASALYDAADGLYARLDALEDRSVVAAVGRSACARWLAEIASEHEDQLESLRTSLAWADAALERDASFYEGAFDRAWARFLLGALEPHEGTDAAGSGDVWRRFEQDLEQALALYGLDVDLLNDLAFVRAQVAALDGRPADAATIGLAERAIRIVTPPTGSLCEADAARRVVQSRCWDTLGTLRERAGDRAGALEAARKAAEVLRPGDAKYADRLARVAELERGG